MSDLSTAIARTVAGPLLTYTKTVAPKKTGEFSAGLVSTTVNGSSTSSIEILSTVENPNPIWLKMGTAPHDIFAKSAQVLKFQGVDGDVFSPSVHHPGTKPSAMYPLLTTYMNSTGRAIMRQAAQSTLREMLHNVANG